DICVITSLQDGSVGVLWSNQNAQRYGFRRHVGSSNPDEWFPDEIPASASAIDHGDGMSADHLNVAVGSDGTLYATVKTSYDTEGMPLVATLVRRPYGRWDPLYHVDDEGSRGIMILDESKEIFLVVYTSYRDQSIVLKRSHTDSISFHNRVTLLKRDRINNVGATRQNVSGSFPIVATQGDSLMHTILVELK
ncbi:T9SS C-terminal target domain-containing protein, partial [bacterium]|nr:T9SS C-terminal target domain-containing protein [bacterium]